MARWTIREDPNENLTEFEACTDRQVQDSVERQCTDGMCSQSACKVVGHRFSPTTSEAVSEHFFVDKVQGAFVYAEFLLKYVKIATPRAFFSLKETLIKFAKGIPFR